MKETPPKYVNTPSSVVYDLEIPSSMIVTYIRLRGLAWRNKGLFTPPLHLDELLEITGLKRRAFYQHLSGLRETAPLRWESPQPGHLVLFFDDSDELCELVQKNALKSTGSERREPIDAAVKPGETPTSGGERRSVQKNAQRLINVVVNPSSISRSIDESGEQQHSLLLEGGLGGDGFGAEKCTGDGDLLAALISAGVSRERARALISAHPGSYLLQKLDHYTWARARGSAYSAGYLVSAIDQDWPPPPGYVPPDGRCPNCGIPWKERNDECHLHRSWHYRDLDAWETPAEMLDELVETRNG